MTLDTTVVEPATNTHCAAGIGVGNTGMPSPPALAVVAMRIEIHDLDSGAVTPISEFDFTSDAQTSAGLAAGSGGTAAEDPNPLFPGAAWFGFSAPVEPFTLDLARTERVRMVFDLHIPAELLPLTVIVQFAAGEAEPDGTPVFTGDHPVSYFTAQDPYIALAPDFLFGDGFEAGPAF